MTDRQTDRQTDRDNNCHSKWCALQQRYETMNKRISWHSYKSYRTACLSHNASVSASGTMFCFHVKKC